jgi:protein TonB
MATTPTIETRLGEKTPRRFARHRVEALMYLDLGPDNGGFPLNLSEDGMAFQGVRALRQGEEISITLRLSGITQPVIASAKIIWLTASQKGGGLQFVNLPEASRKRIREWIAGEEEKEHNRQSTLTMGSPAPPIAPRTPAVIAQELDRRPLPVHRDAPGAAPVPPSLIPKSVAAPAIAPSEISQPRVEAAKPVPPAPFQSFAMRKENPRKKSRPSSDQSRNTNHAVRYGVGLAALGIALVIGASLLWPYREKLLSRLDSLNPAASSAESDAAPASSAGQALVTEPSSGPAIDGATNTNAIQAEQEILPLRPLPNSMSGALPTGAGNSATKPVQENRRISANPPVRTTVDAPPAKSAVQPAKIDSAQINSVKINSAQINSVKISPATIRPSAPVTPSPAPSTSALPAASPANATPVAANPPPAPETAPARMAIPEPAPQPAPATPTGTVEIIPDPYPSIRMPADQGASPNRAETSLQLGRLASRIEPAYPLDALQHRIAGTVTVHVVISRSGTVQSAEIVSGPAPLADAALRVVQQWRYEPTKLGGTPIEVEEEVRLVFRVGNSPAGAK